MGEAKQRDGKKEGSCLCFMLFRISYGGRVALSTKVGRKKDWG